MGGRGGGRARDTRRPLLVDVASGGSCPTPASSRLSRLSVGLRVRLSPCHHRAPAVHLHCAADGTISSPLLFPPPSVLVFFSPAIYRCQRALLCVHCPPSVRAPPASSCLPGPVYRCLLYNSASSVSTCVAFLSFIALHACADGLGMLVPLLPHSALTPRSTRPSAVKKPAAVKLRGAL